MRASTCAFTFRKKAGLKLEDFAQGVYLGIFSNLLIFLLPPTTAVAFQKLITDFSTCRKAYEQGGIAQKPAYLAAKKALIAALNILAPYVDTIAMGDIPTINMAGFEATYDPTHIKPGPSKVQSLTLVVEKAAVEELVTDCESFPKGTEFIGILSEGVPLPAGVTVDVLGAVDIPALTPNRIIVHTSKKKKKTFKNLKSGLYYYGYYFILNKLGASQLSNPVKTMCQ